MRTRQLLVTNMARRYIPLSDAVIRSLCIWASCVCMGLPALFSAEHYIRAGASTGLNSGASWDNAWTHFAHVTWTRGDTYYLAGGTYAEDVTISVAESGAARVTLKKANAVDNATNPGWSSTYATAQAIIQGNVRIDGSYITIDGVTGTARSGHGMKIYQTVVGGGNAIVNYADAKSFLSFSHVELQGPGMGYAVGASGFKQNNLTITGKGLFMSHLYFHDLSQNGFVFVNVAGTSFSDYGLIFDHIVLDDCGYNIAGQHGQGIQVGSGAGPSTNSYWTIRNSIFHNVVGTGDIACLGYSQNDHMDIYNNIFYNQEQSFSDSGTWTSHTKSDASSPGVIYISDTSATAAYVRIYNNTFYNIARNTIYFGGSKLTNNEVVNNLFVHGYFNQRHVGVIGHHNDYSGCEPMVSSGIYGVPYGEVGQQGEPSSPCLNAAGGDFRLRSDAHAIGNGADLSAVFTTDFFGNTRTTWDIGACGYSTAPAP